MRPLGIPSVDDKLVQEVIRMILESIFEPTFSRLSHGFRPNKSCHTALVQIKKEFTGAKWFIEGDIKGFFDNIDHQIMIATLLKRIDDEYFIALIWKFLKAGYLECWQFNKTYSGTPQGSIISPILSNIYLDTLDKYMERYIEQFDKGKVHKRTKEYRSREYKLCLKRKEVKNRWNDMSDIEKAQALKEIKYLKAEMQSVHCKDPMDKSFRRMKYVRYADDFLIGIIGTKKEAEEVKSKIGEFIANELKLEMSDEKTFKGYGPEQGYDFLRNAIKGYYNRKGINLEVSEIFVSDGAKSDTGNITDLFSVDNIVMIPDPVYPVYVDTNIMNGREIVYIDANKDNDFLPLPDENKKADLIYICSPNNPTGACYNKEQLKMWVDYALKNEAIILFDAAYECFIADDSLPTSIFEIEGARKCAIEFCSLSKTSNRLLAGSPLKFLVILSISSIIKTGLELPHFLIPLIILPGSAPT